MGSLINILLFFSILICLGLVWFILIAVIKGSDDDRCDGSGWIK